MAETDIKVYKILARNNLSPIFDMKFKNGRNYPFGKEDIRPSEIDTWIVRGGFLHACATKEAAKKSLFYDINHNKIEEMVIPTGAQYYVSLNGRNICASCLEWRKETLIDKIKNWFRK